MKEDTLKAIAALKRNLPKEQWPKILQGEYAIEWAYQSETANRKGWEAAAKRCHQNGDDQSLMSDVFEDDEVLPW